VRIGITFDLVPAERDGDGPDDRYEEFDKPETVEAIAAVLRGEGHEVVLLGDGRDFLRRVLADPPDFVWNNAEGEGIGRSREARVPAVLEMLGIPYSGSDPLTLAAALDKGVARRLVQAERVSVPRGAVLPAEATPAEEGAAFGGLHGAYPVILKPAFEGSSKGIRARCLAETEAEAGAVFRRLARDYRQPILAEEFIEGDEVTVGLVGGGDRVEVIGAMLVRPKVANRRFVYSLEMKRNWRAEVEYEIPPRLPEGMMERLILSARAAYEALGCRDVARIDFRVRAGIPYFIEANPLPGLAPGWSDLVILARGCGLDHPGLIRRILREALERVGLAHPEVVAP
jgi:D-alanine-D-alanine ligase